MVMALEAVVRCAWHCRYYRQSASHTVSLPARWADGVRSRLPTWTGTFDSIPHEALRLSYLFNMIKGVILKHASKHFYDMSHKFGRDISAMIVGHRFGVHQSYHEFHSMKTKISILILQLVTLHFDWLTTNLPICRCRNSMSDQTETPFMFPHRILFCDLHIEASIANPWLSCVLLQMFSLLLFIFSHFIWRYAR